MGCKKLQTNFLRVVHCQKGSSAKKNVSDYFSGGMAMPNRQIINGEPYRYGYQGQEKDPETGKEAFQLRIYDSRINKWLNPDPYGQYFSPYLSMGNNWISRVDPDGGTDCPDPPCTGMVNQLDEVVVTFSRPSTWAKGATFTGFHLEHASFVRNNFYVPNEKNLFQALKNNNISQVRYSIDRFNLQGEARNRMTKIGQAASELLESRASQRANALKYVRGEKTVNLNKVSNTRNLGVKGTLLKGATRATIVYGIYSTVEHIHNAEDKGLAISQEAGGWTGAWGGAKAGAAIGSFFGPAGTIIGGIIGGAVGYAAGYSAGGTIYREFD